MIHDISVIRQSWVDQVSNYMLKGIAHRIAFGILVLWALELDHKTYRCVIIGGTTGTSA